VRHVAALTLALFMAAGCDRATPTGERTTGARHGATASASAEIPASVVRGEVLLEGVAPVAPPILLGAADGCGSLRASAPAEKLLVSGGRIANVLVRVKSGPAPEQPWAVPTEPVLLDQRGCVFEPHVVAVRAGQPLHIRNSDPLLHNVNVRPSRARNDASNRSLGPRSSELEFVFPAAEAAIAVRCDIHPWMQAYVHVLDTPHFALTGADGSFELSGLAPGKYELEVVHEWLGKHAFEVALDPASGTRVTVTLALP